MTKLGPVLGPKPQVRHRRAAPSVFRWNSSFFKATWATSTVASRSSEGLNGGGSCCNSFNGSGFPWWKTPLLLKTFRFQHVQKHGETSRFQNPSIYHRFFASNCISIQLRPSSLICLSVPVPVLAIRVAPEPMAAKLKWWTNRGSKALRKSAIFVTWKKNRERAMYISIIIQYYIYICV